VDDLCSLALTEDSGTADLREAKALLDDLSYTKHRFSILRMLSEQHTGKLTARPCYGMITRDQGQLLHARLIRR
jgi:hypothetical protein